MMSFTTMIKIALIVVLIIESGFVESLERGITRFLRFIKILPAFSEFHFSKPFNCSLCLTFWTLLVMLILNNVFTIDNILLVLIVSYLTDIITDFLYLIIDLIKKLISIIRTKLSI